MALHSRLAKALAAVSCASFVASVVIMTLLVLSEPTEPKTVHRTPFDHGEGIALIGVCVAQFVALVMGITSLWRNEQRRVPAIVGVAISGVSLTLLVPAMILGSLMAGQY